MGVAELVHGIYRAQNQEVANRRRAFVEEIVRLIPVRSVTSTTGWLMGQVEGQEASKRNVLSSNDLMIAVSALEQEGYGVLTGNLRDFDKIPGLRVVPI